MNQALTTISAHRASYERRFQRVIDYAEKKTLGKGSECDLDKIDPAVAERLGVVIEYPSPQSSNLNGFEEFEVKEVS